MKKKKNLKKYASSLALMLLLPASCVKDEIGGISLVSESTTELYSVSNNSAEIRFNASGSWKASCTAPWLTFSPKSGEAGQNVITVSTTALNRTKAVRTARLTIESGGKTETINVKQRDEYAYFESDELNLSCAETTIGVRFWTNLEREQLSLYATNGMADWIISPNSTAEGRSRAEYEGSLSHLRVMANPSRNPRTGAFFLAMTDKYGAILALDTLHVYQEGSDNGYHSNDYTADGRVEQLNTATEGKGIPLVLMGDGFVDEEITNGTYRQVMQQAMDNLFSEEPIRSLRQYFNVYEVTAVSDRNRFDGGSTALKTIPDRQTTGIDVDPTAVMRYVKRVEGIDSIHALAVVILNTNLNKGVTYMIASSDTDYSYAIALCPVIDSLKSETFRQVITHEAIGHGFAKLADEYVRVQEGSATDDDIKQLKLMHDRWQWHMNVDSEKDSAKVVWSKMITDAAFATEKIGTYEGAYTFYKGMYRPSEESMMRSNNAPFNAPSRQAIYNQVMKLASGRTPGYEEFVAFDLAHKPERWSYTARAMRGGTTPLPSWQRPAPPRVIWKTW